MANYNRAMKKAPKDEEFLALVPTGNPGNPIAREISWWDAREKRFSGDWRYYHGPGGYPDSDPIAWTPLPEIDVGLAEPVGRPSRASRNRSEQIPPELPPAQ